MQNFFENTKVFLKNYINKEYSSTEIVKSSFALGLLYMVFVYFVRKNSYDIYNIVTLALALYAVLLGSRIAYLAIKQKENRFVYILGLVPIIAIIVSIPILKNLI